MNSDYNQLPLPVGIYYTLLLGCALVALVQQVREDIRFRGINPLPAWQLRRIDAFFLVWAVFVGSVAISLLVGEAVRLIDDDTWKMVVGIAAWQVGLLAAIAAAMRAFPGFFSLSLSPQTISLRCALKNAILHLLGVFPLILLVALCWEQVLEQIGRLGFGNYLKPQEVLEMVSPELPLPTLVAMVLTAVVVAPLMEELLFRGLLYRMLKAHLSARMAMVLSSVAFGLIHFNVLSLLPLTLLGMAFARAYERTGSLKVPILMHALFNANSLLTALLLKPGDAAAAFLPGLWLPSF